MIIFGVLFLSIDTITGQVVNNKKEIYRVIMHMRLVVLLFSRKRSPAKTTTHRFAFRASRSTTTGQYRDGGQTRAAVRTKM